MQLSKLFPITSLIQGDFWNFQVSLYNYDANLYTLTYTFKKMGSDTISMIAVNESGSFAFSVASATTSTYAPGLYYVVASIVEIATGNKTTLGQTELQIKPDLSTFNGDPRSAYRIALDDVEAALAAGAGSDVQEYTVGGRTVKKNRLGLLELRNFYLQRVRVEAGKSTIGTIYYSL